MKKPQALIFSLTTLCTCMVPVVASGCKTHQVVESKESDKGCDCNGHDKASSEGCSCKGDSCGCGGGSCGSHH